VKFPRGLESYREVLGLFPEDLAGALLPWVAQLDSALGKPTADFDNRGEPDGYDGVASRGDYERLLTSEWAWADTEPLEFLRRSVMSEQLFFRRAFESRRSSRRVIAVFDAGPTQLGAPRLAHLAVMLVLARRAERDGGSFEWGSVVEPDQRRIGVEREGLLALLNCRTWSLPSSQSFDAWLDSAGDGADLWWIGTAPPRAVNVVAIEELETSLRVEVKTPGRVHSRIELPLPGRAIAHRLLRAPFADPVTSTRGVALSRTGSRVIVCSESGKVQAFGLKHPESSPEEFQAPAEEQVLAADFGRSRLVVFTLVPQAAELRIWRDSTEPYCSVPLADLPMTFEAPEPGSPLLDCCFLGKRHPLAAVVDARGTLFEVAAKPRVLATHVGAFAVGNDSFAALSTVHGRSGAVHPKLESWDLAGNHSTHAIPYAVSARAGFLTHRGYTSLVWAVENTREPAKPSQWLVSDGPMQFESVSMAPSEEILGVGFLDEPGLFFQRDGQLMFATARTERTVMTLDGNIRKMHVGCDRSTAALELHGGHWQAINLLSGEVLRSSWHKR